MSEEIEVLVVDSVMVNGRIWHPERRNNNVKEVAFLILSIAQETIYQGNPS
ncbi:hypothetical protein H6F75_08150 [Nodosilinea sp. FACHB-131]|uniref:hypothetical protein n=1 Tax=Cyanophyceae TaxID=3028117 RepID=UPI0016878D7D|nr:hypothetical protein [Nodosilinea sp. FACHB-131]MBD1873449.1 hypothetical protein [Nodosilinea sp. FACHB-131]